MSYLSFFTSLQCRLRSLFSGSCCLAAVLVVSLLEGCASAPEPRPPDDQLYFVSTQRNQFMWTDWDFFPHTPNSWYVDGTYTGIALGQELVIHGDWYDPAKSVQRETLSVLTTTGLIFPPNFLFIFGLLPDLKCIATFNFPFLAEQKYRVKLTFDGVQLPVMLGLYAAEDSELMSQVPCEKR